MAVILGVTVDFLWPPIDFTLIKLNIPEGRFFFVTTFRALLVEPFFVLESSIVLQVLELFLFVIVCLELKADIVCGAAVSVEPGPPWDKVFFFLRVLRATNFFGVGDMYPCSVYNLIRRSRVVKLAM